MGIQHSGAQVKLLGDLAAQPGGICGDDLDASIVLAVGLDMVAGLGGQVEVQNTADHRLQLLPVYEVRADRHTHIDGENDVHQIKVGILFPDECSDDIDTAAGAVQSQGAGIDDASNHTGGNGCQHNAGAAFGLKLKGGNIQLADNGGNGGEGQNKNGLDVQQIDASNNQTIASLGVKAFFRKDMLQPGQSWNSQSMLPGFLMRSLLSVPPGNNITLQNIPEVFQGVTFYKAFD